MLDTEERKEEEDTKLNVNVGIFIQDLPDATVGENHVGTVGALFYKLDPDGNSSLKPARVSTSSILKLSWVPFEVLHSY